ncbi:Homeobox [Macrophomina phaseolina MS6]|uniref:Homeobox n=1 Tax=Macrophomina phaseolina (strain MS6) TaxID=1126212 RepID=K2SE59_MACPH|nr:Homeobox [Macrophomina phaseolina MS6]
MSYYQTSSSRTSRQNSTERPVFNDPFRAPPHSTSPLRVSDEHPRVPPPAENYTTRNEARNSVLHSGASPTPEHRKSSMRADYEPRAALPPLFPPSRAVSHDSGPPAARHQYYQSGPYPQPLQVPQELRRASEVPYRHPGYAVYPPDPYRQRPSWGSESPNYSRHYQRHDSTVYAGPEHPWGFGYPPSYSYGVDGAHPDGNGRRRRGNLPKEATALLKQWFHDHSDAPYPSDEEKSALAMQTGLSNAQISNWFINARRRTPGREAREQAKQNRQNQALMQGQQQRPQQDAEEEQLRSAHALPSGPALYHQE